MSSSFESYFYYNIGKKIRYYREQSGLTQEMLSEKLGVNEKYIGHVERCERFISTKMLVRLMEFWQLQPSDFYNFDEVYNY
jgi:transcriptional regulator with XRE-family HTH domain